MSLQRYLMRLIGWCLLPVVVLAGALAIGHVNDVQHEDRADAQGLAQTLAMTVDESLRARIAGLQTLALSPLADDPARWSELHREAQGFYAAYGSHVALIDSSLRPRLHTMVRFGDALPPLPHPFVQRAVKAALAGATPMVSDPYLGLVTQEPTIAIVVPVLRQGQPAAALASLLPLKQLARLLDDQALPPGWRLVLTDSRSQPIVHRGPAAPADAGTAWVTQESTAAAPWSVQVSIPLSARLQRLAPPAMQLALAVLVVTAVAVTGGLLASRRLARSVHSLVDPTVAQHAPEITEVSHARRLLGESVARRDAAEAEQRSSEQRFRLRLEQQAHELQVREAQLRGIFESANEAILTADESHRIVMANAAAARTFGVPLERLVGSPLEALMPERFRARHRHDVAAFGRAESPSRAMGRRRDVMGQRADGAEFPIEAAISHLHIDGRRLYTVILRDVSERRQAEAALLASQSELQASHAELQRLIAAQQSVEENERKRIARELHDELQQVLAAIKMDVAAIEGEMAIDPKRVAPLVARIDELAGSAITSSRRIVNDLRPLLLEELGLVAALQALAAQFSLRTGIAASVDTGGRALADDAVPGPLAICLYRVAQESLNNVGKHAAARRVQLRLLGLDDGGVVLRVTDDGRGIGDGERRKPQSFGLRGMNERVRAFGGRLRVERGADGGTVVEVEIHARPSSADAAA
jgi:PAS domain S-box-containing protein